MPDATTAAAARALIDRSQYLTLASAGADGRPWVSPVWFAHLDYREFVWVSRPDARHSLNLAARRDVAVVVFDSTVAPRDAQAVYVEAEAEEVGAEALDRTVGAYSERSVASGLSPWTAADVTGAARHRLYRARALASFVLAANDRRVPVSLHVSAESQGA
jgi:nitroimidazol reductase NimA-like FMN-containing flavoprotein (pyridoxamine 5'-phosphate oxidase superfamily)